MKKAKVTLISLICILTLHINTIIATPGKLKTNSIITCNGVNYGNHGDGHWHVAVKHDSGWYPSGGSLGYDNPCATTITEEPISREAPIKSSDTSLQRIEIDSNLVSINNTITYTTTNETVSIHAVATHSSATISLDNSQPLQVGTNSRILKVIAEDGTVQEYTLNIIREKIKNSDNSLQSLLINGSPIDISEQMHYVTDKSEISINAIPNDSNANVEVTGHRSLKIGDNAVTVLVIAEDGMPNEYNLNIKRLSNNIGLNVRINGENIEFDAFEAKIRVTTEFSEKDIQYTPEDNNASVQMYMQEETIVFQVTAENGDIQEYTIFMTTPNAILETIMGLGTIVILSFIGYYTYTYIKNKKLNIKKQSISS